MPQDEALELGLKALPFMTHSAKSLRLWSANIGPALGSSIALKGLKIEKRH